MEQNIIGTTIAVLRREKDLTQDALAAPAWARRIKPARQSIILLLLRENVCSPT